MDQYIGRLLDNRYEILEVIGTGGMAVVYKARCHRLNRLVAIKILKDEFARDDEFRRRFHAEGEAVAMLSHANIVQIYDVSSSDNANYIVMELIDGISLKQYMVAKGVLNWKETLHFAMQIAAGLEHAHSRGIVHRDIKPHNVMVLKNGSVKVMDFGIARVMSKSNTLTKEALGSVHYISPEQAKGSHTDNRSDIYSLGVVMYEMMAGRPPYDGESPVAVAIQHINGGAPAPSAYNPNIPRALELIIMKAMALEIQDRFVSAGEMLRDMEEFRKNPAIEFHYRSVMDDATRKVPVITAVSNAPRTVAEKMEQQKSGTVSPRTSEPVRTAKPQAPQPTPTKRKNPERPEVKRQPRTVRHREPDPKPSRAATAAIVVCCLVAAVAIILFLVALFNGMLLNRDRDLIEVPNLVGKLYDEDLMEIYSDFEIRFNPQQYNDTYEKGKIIDQEPAAGNGIRVQKGSEIWITISMGQEPAVKVMESLVGLSEGEAASYLKGQGYTPLSWEEYSEFFEEGHVIRTDPAEGTELIEGQTIKLYISKGPEVELQPMPDVTGMDEATARKVLDQLGFKNVEVRSVESDRPKGIVVKQSEEEKTKIDITTQIILSISEGPAETTAPPEPEETKPKETEPKEEIMDVTFYLPEREVPYTLTIFCNGWQVTAARTIEAGVTEITLEMSGSGTRRYDLYIDDTYYGSQDVVFGQYG
ncbi:MAG: Stk1 family PASTA domain-containing Ser/Thr kinase [Oscillospiraceae bacterium]|nr:Stk1 family PASTA domain-containing Ser/Thr kinase [Oscillospiraceae bacterium]